MSNETTKTAHSYKTKLYNTPEKDQGKRSTTPVLESLGKTRKASANNIENETNGKKDEKLNKEQNLVTQDTQEDTRTVMSDITNEPLIQNDNTPNKGDDEATVMSEVTLQLIESTNKDKKKEATKENSTTTIETNKVMNPYI